MGGRSALPAVLATWAGMAVGAAVPAGAGWWLLATVPVYGWSHRRTVRLAEVGLLVALVCAGAARFAAHRERLEAERRLVDAAALYRVHGWIEGPPARFGGAPLAIVAVDEAEPPLARGARLRVRLPRGCSAEWGDRIEARVQIEVPGGPRNPGGASPEAMANASRVSANGRVLTLTVRDSTGTWPRATVARWRRAIERTLARGLSAEAAELVLPLVTGDRSGMSAELTASLRAAGIVHLLALSGLHVSGMAEAARGGVAAMNGGLGARALAGVVCALLYVGIAGPLSSLVRAAVTECLGAIARLTGRALDGMQALAASALTILLVAPGWSADLGFQLSCAATAGLIAGTQCLRDVRGAGPTWRGIAGAVGAQLAAAPLLLAHFRAISWVAPAVNLAAVPLGGVLLAAAWIAVLWELTLPGTGRVWFAACEAITHGLKVVSDLGARWPGAFSATGANPALSWCAAAGAILWIAAAGQGRTLVARRAGAPMGVTAAVLAGAGCWTATLVVGAGTRPLTPAADEAWVVVLDVGQGDAIALGFAGGWWLVDAGPGYEYGDAGTARILPFLRWAGVRGLVGLVVTHADRDHVGGAASIAREMRVRRAWTTAEARARTEGIPAVEWLTAARGDTLAHAPALVALWPPPGEPTTATSRNHRSLVLALEHEGVHGLLLADVDTLAEDAIPAPRAALIKVAHHGSRTSTTDRWLDRVRPEHAAISCGARNRYGHPDAQVLDRLRRAGVRVGRTDREGALWYVVRRGGVERWDWRGGAPVPRSAETAERPFARP